MISRLIAVLVLVETGHMGVRTTLGKVNAAEAGPAHQLEQHVARTVVYEETSKVDSLIMHTHLQHEAKLALMKFAEKGGTTTVVIPTSMQSAPLIHIGGK